MMNELKISGEKLKNLQKKIQKFKKARPLND